MSSEAGASASDREQAPPPDLSAFCAGIAADLDLLAELHDRPLTAAAIAAAREAPFSSQLALSLASPAGHASLSAIDESLSSLPGVLAQEVLDAIAADHADIYQRYHYRASPTESVWRTEDGLERQAPMFQVQQWYRRHGLKVDDADKRPDDHIVLQLQFLAHVVEQARAAGDLVAVARFLDEHPLTWMAEFAARLGERGAAPFYTALAALTAAYLEELREHLVEITGHARPAARPFEPTRLPGGKEGELTCGDPDERPFVPGVAPSW